MYVLNQLLKVLKQVPPPPYILSNIFFIFGALHKLYEQLEYALVLGPMQRSTPPFILFTHTICDGPKLDV